MRNTALVLVVGLTTFAVGCRKKPDSTPSGGAATPEADRLQGQWATEAFEPDPTEGPKPDEAKTFRLVIEGNKLTTTMEGDKTRTYSFTINSNVEPKVMTVTQLDENSKPFRLDTAEDGTEKDERVDWIYRFDGQTLVIATTKYPGERPSDFKPRPSRGEQSVILTGEKMSKTKDTYIPGVNVIRMKKTQGTPITVHPHPRDPDRSTRK